MLILYTTYTLLVYTQTLRDLKALEDARLDAEAIRDEALYTAARIEENMDATISLAWLVYHVYLYLYQYIHIYVYYYG